MTVPHADYAVAITQQIEVSTKDGITGRVIALGWWIDPDTAADSKHEPAGTLYLVVDPHQPRPVWVAEGDLVATRMV